VTNELIAKPQDDGKLLAGAGPFDTAEDLYRDAALPFQEGKGVNAVSLGINAGAMAIDVVGAAVDPFGTLASSVVGWIIENIGPVRRAFDDLMGDPPAVEAAANTFTNIAGRMADIRGSYESALSGLAGWTGPAADKYKEQAKGLMDGLTNAEAAAESTANKIKIAGVLVTTTRALVRDILAELAGTLITWGIPAAAAAIPTAGASVAAFITRAVTKAVEVGAKIARFLKQLFGALDKLADMAKRAATAMRGKADELARLARDMPSTPHGTQRAADLLNQSGTRAARADSLDNAASRMDGMATSGRNGLDRAANSMDSWAANTNRRVNDWASRVKSNGPGRRDAVRNAYNRAGQPPLSTRSDNMTPNNPVGRRADPVDSHTGKGTFDGQNWVRMVGSRDVRHIMPTAGDGLVVVKEAGKATNAMFFSNDTTKWSENDRKDGGFIYPYR
jgi:uncharacterized protein YukE